MIVAAQKGTIAAVVGLFLIVSAAVYFGFFYQWSQPVATPTPLETPTPSPTITPERTGEPPDYSAEAAIANLTGTYQGTAEKFDIECNYPGNWQNTSVQIAQTHTTSITAPNSSDNTIEFGNSYFVDPRTGRFIKYTPSDLAGAIERYKSSFNTSVSGEILVGGQTATQLTEAGPVGKGRVKSMAVFLSPDSTALFEFFLYDPNRMETFARILDTCRFMLRAQ